MIVGKEALKFESLPGRSSADPLAGPSSDPFAGAGIDFTVRIAHLSGDSLRWAHRHPHSVELMHVTRGEGVLWEDGVRRRFVEGDTALIPVGVPHATVPDAGTEMEVICFFPHPELADNIEELEDMIVNEGRERTEHE